MPRWAERLTKRLMTVANQCDGKASMTSPQPLPFDALIDQLVPHVLSAARLELAYLAEGVATEHKQDKSPVTVADREAEDILLAALASAAPGIPVVAEEQTSAGRYPDIVSRAFFVDALDGTREFIRGGNEFTINIGLIEDRAPVFGLIYAPSFGELFVTRAPGTAVKMLLAPDAQWRGLADANAPAAVRLTGRDPDRSRLVAFNRRSTKGASAEFLTNLGVDMRLPLSSSLKFCRLAEGEGDLYARFGDTCEWDTAAGHAILQAAGGSVTEPDGTPLVYRHLTPQFLNPHFVAWGRQSLVG